MAQVRRGEDSVMRLDACSPTLRPDACTIGYDVQLDV